MASAGTHITYIDFLTFHLGSLMSTGMTLFGFEGQSQAHLWWEIPVRGGTLRVPIVKRSRATSRVIPCHCYWYQLGRRMTEAEPTTGNRSRSHPIALPLARQQPVHNPTLIGKVRTLFGRNPTNCKKQTCACVELHRRVTTTDENIKSCIMGQGGANERNHR